MRENARMKSSRYMPISAQAEITRKCHFDIVEVRNRKLNTDKEQSYKNGQDTDFWVMPGELVFARRNRHNYSYQAGPISERGFTSLNGINWGGYGSDEQMMDDFYLVGIAKTEFEYGGDRWAYDDPLDHGFSVIGAGSYSTNNHGPEQIHAGDVLVWEFPKTGRDGAANALNVAKQYQQGTPYTKILAYLRPLHINGCKSHALALQSVLTTATARGGVDGFADAANELKNNERLSPAQEEALHLQLAANPVEGGADALEHYCQAAYLGMMQQFSRVAGVALNSAAPGETLNIMLSHFKCN